MSRNPPFFYAKSLYKLCIINARKISRNFIKLIYNYFNKINKFGSPFYFFVLSDSTLNLHIMSIIGDLKHHISWLFMLLTSILCFLIRCHKLR
jgi:hypothetical protein